MCSDRGDVLQVAGRMAVGPEWSGGVARETVRAEWDLEIEADVGVRVPNSLLDGWAVRLAGS